MPGMDGEQTAREIKNDPLVRDAQIVVLTSMGQRGRLIGGIDICPAIKGKVYPYIERAIRQHRGGEHDGAGVRAHCGPQDGHPGGDGVIGRVGGGGAIHRGRKHHLDSVGVAPCPRPGKRERPIILG